MGAPSAWVGHSGNCPSSLQPDGMRLPAGGAGDLTVYISAGDGVHLPVCCTRTVEGRCWSNEGLTPSSRRCCVLVSGTLTRTMCSSIQVTTSFFIPSPAGYLVTKIQCDLHSPPPRCGYIPGDD